MSRVYASHHVYCQTTNLKKLIDQFENLHRVPTLRPEVRRLATKRDEAWRHCEAAANQIESQEDSVLDRVEKRLAQYVFAKQHFAIWFEMVLYT